MPRIMRVFLCGLGFVLALAGHPALAKKMQSPDQVPWIEPDLAGTVHDAAVRERIGHLNWILARQRSDTYRYGHHALSAERIVYEIGYYGNTTNERNWEVLRDFAERSSFLTLEFRELLLLEYQRLWADAPISTSLRNQALDKTALFMLMHHGLNSYFPNVFSTLDQEIDVEALKADFKNRPTIKPWINGGPAEGAVQDEILLSLTLEAINRIPVMQRYLTETPACELVDDASSFLEETSPGGRNEEVAQMILRYIIRYEPYNLGGADALFLLAKHYNDFHMYRYRLFPSADMALSTSVLLGHPAATLLASEREKAKGNLEAAADYFLYAKAAGLTKASPSIRDYLESLPYRDLRSRESRAQRIFRLHSHNICQ